MDHIPSVMDVGLEIFKDFMPIPLAQQIEYVIDLPENVDTLMKEARVLKSKRKDFEEEASRKRRRPTNEVEKWLQEAANIETEIDSIKSEISGGTTSLISRLRLGRRAVRTLRDVKELNEKGVFDPVVASPSPARLLKMPTKSIIETEIDSIKSKFDGESTNLMSHNQLGERANLDITFHDIDSAAQDALYQCCSSLSRYRICVGDHRPPTLKIFNQDSYLPCKKLVEVNGNNHHSWVQMILTHAEGLSLYLANAKHISQLVEGSKSLRFIDILHCSEMECLIDWREVRDGALLNIENLHLFSLCKLKTLFLGEVPHGMLQKLREIHISHCNNLKRLFSSKIVKHLDRLEILDVSYCNELEEIIEGDKPSLCSLKPQFEKEREIIDHPLPLLPSLRQLRCFRCPKLEANTPM